MSAFVLSDHHISALATYARDHLGCDGAAAATMLRAANVRSVEARYGARASEFVPVAPVVYTPCTVADLHTVLKACDCYDYQACEAADYYISDAGQLSAAIGRHAFDRLGPDVAQGHSTHPLYDAAPWALDAADVSTGSANVHAARVEALSFRAWMIREVGLGWYVASRRLARMGDRPCVTPVRMERLRACWAAEVADGMGMDLRDLARRLLDLQGSDLAGVPDDVAPVWIALRRAVESAVHA